MNSIQKTALSALLGLGSALAFAPRATAGGIALQVLRPDLRIKYVGPASVHAKAVYFAVTNSGTQPSPAFYVRVKVKAPLPKIAYQLVPPLPAGMTYDFNVYMGYSPLATPGLVTEAVADAFSTVTEVSESNNVAIFVAPGS